MPYRAYITGDTFRFKNIFKSYGYSWDAAAEAWFLDYEGQVTPAYAIDRVRASGIRNRGSFEAVVIELPTRKQLETIALDAVRPSLHHTRAKSACAEYRAKGKDGRHRVQVTAGTLTLRVIMESDGEVVDWMEW